MKKEITKTQQDFANIVKKKAWANNVRATTKGVPSGCVLIADKWLVGQYDDPRGKNAPRVNFRAIVRDYGAVVRVSLYDKKGKELKAPFYRLGRLGLSI
jgi:hypothetical protein